MGPHDSLSHLKTALKNLEAYPIVSIASPDDWLIPSTAVRPPDLAGSRLHIVGTSVPVMDPGTPSCNGFLDEAWIPAAPTSHA